MVSPIADKWTQPPRGGAWRKGFGVPAVLATNGALPWFESKPKCTSIIAIMVL